MVFIPDKIEIGNSGNKHTCFNTNSSNQSLPVNGVFFGIVRLLTVGLKGKPEQENNKNSNEDFKGNIFSGSKQYLMSVKS